jgi:hypothetical protein
MLALLYVRFKLGGDMEQLVQLCADVRRELKTQLFAELAWRGERYNNWLSAQIELWLRENRRLLVRPETAACEEKKLGTVV